VGAGLEGTSISGGYCQVGHGRCWNGGFKKAHCAGTYDWTGKELAYRILNRDSQSDFESYDLSLSGAMGCLSARHEGESLEGKLRLNKKKREVGGGLKTSGEHSLRSDLHAAGKKRTRQKTGGGLSLVVKGIGKGGITAHQKKPESKDLISAAHRQEEGNS